MSTITILGSKFKTGKTLVAPNNAAVSAYLKAAKEGKGLAEKVLNGLKKNKKYK